MKRFAHGRRSPTRDTATTVKTRTEPGWRCSGTVHAQHVTPNSSATKTATTLSTTDRITTILRLGRLSRSKTLQGLALTHIIKLYFRPSSSYGDCPICELDFKSAEEKQKHFSDTDHDSFRTHFVVNCQFVFKPI